MEKHQVNSSHSNLTELLDYRARNQAHQVAYSFLRDGETASADLTYHQLQQRATAIAFQLQSIITQGDPAGICFAARALLVYPYNAPLDFIAAFFGCLYAGVIAVTDHPPRHGKALSNLEARAISSQASMILTTKALKDEIKGQLAENPANRPQLNKLPWLATDEIVTDVSIDWQPPELDPENIGFLQYTSGSTGTPKGVMVTHGNILNNSRVIYQCFEHTSKTRVLMWLPLYHDMGLVGGVMQPLYGGFPVMLMSPIDLIQKPLRWLEAISRYRITTSGGPNFAYDLLCQKVTPEQRANLDLSSWDVAFSGAEPVWAETLEKFTTMFEPCGFRKEAFYPCYGMAEATLLISGGYKQATPIIKYLDRAALAKNQVVTVTSEQENARAMVGCGRGWLGDQIAIVDTESLTRREANQIGEIWVSGAGVGKGYWHQPEETKETFEAYLKDTGEGPFLRTGDLGFIHEGELFITGRIKDLMILWGRNFYPQHLEKTVEESYPALRSNCGAAFSIEINGEEKLVIAHEVERSYLRNLNVDEVVAAIRLNMALEHIAEVYAVVLLKTGSIPKTSSGKIQRSLCKAKFLEGSLEVVGEWHSSQEQETNISDLFTRYSQ